MTLRLDHVGRRPCRSSSGASCGRCTVSISGAIHHRSDGCQIAGINNRLLGSAHRSPTANPPAQCSGSIGLAGRSPAQRRFDWCSRVPHVVNDTPRSRFHTELGPDLRAVGLWRVMVDHEDASCYENGLLLASAGRAQVFNFTAVRA